MKAAIYNPYLDTLGGGERYTLAFANALAKEGFRVDVQWKESKIKKSLASRFGLEIDELNIVKDVKRGEGYDVCFWVSDGSIPMLKARQNYLHFQIPFIDVGGKTLLNRMKLYRVNKVICNSYFTKRFIDKEFGVKSTVIYPPVDNKRLKPKKKENVILNVGRFSQLAQAKKQAVLISAFKTFYDSGNINWSFVLAGGSEVGSKNYVKALKKSAKTYPIQIIESPDFNQIASLYGKAKIYWSAAGYNIDEKLNPAKVEHFGITLVEAMSAGCVPLAYSAGGHKEIIDNGENGYLWRTKKRLLNNTREIIKNVKLYRKLVNEGIRNSKIYEYERFESEVRSLL